MALYDVAHLVSWNGYTEDMRSYLGVDKAAWTNKEFWFPFGVNILYGPKRKTRLQRICEEMNHGYDGKNYYHHAMMRSYDAVSRIRQLLADGAKPDIKDTDGWSGLLVCCRNGFEGHLEIAKLLLDAGADINQTAHVYSPLHYAANNGNIHILRELLRRGALHISTDQGSTPIGFACQHGHLDIVKELVKAGAIVDAEVFKLAILGGNVAIVKYLLTLMPPPNDSVYHAVYYKKPNVIRALAKAGADMNFRFPLHNAINCMDHSCLAELCASGANVNLLDQHNESPLCYAIIAANPEAIKTLTKYKANVNGIVRDEPLLHYAIGMYDAVAEDKKERKMCVLAMIEAGPNFKLLDIWGNTAAENAAEKNMPDIVIQIKRAELKQRFSSHAKR